MEKRFMTLLLVLSLVFLVGCQQKTTTPTFSGKAFIGGNQGLEMTFLPNSPPKEIFDVDSPFFISVKIENKGEYNIDSGDKIKISVTGINPSDFKVNTADLTKNSPNALNGVTVDTTGNKISGDFVTIDFPEMNYFKQISGTVPLPLRANACYEYGTKAQGKLCVRKDLRGVTGQTGVCDPNRVVPAENSGAPVQISDFKQNVAGSNKIDFFFTIKKSGAATDSLYKKGTSCDIAVANTDLVYVEVSDTGLGTLSCMGLKDGTATSGYVKLFNGQQEVRCSQTITNPDDFEKVVDIKLTYDYKQFIDTQISVKHASS